MSRRKAEEEAGSPAWMMTMGDMNMLLMVFFIMLFSLMTQDKGKSTTLEEGLLQMSGTGRIDVDAPTKESADSQTVGFVFDRVPNENFGQMKIIQIAGRYATLQRLEEGTLLTLGGQEGTFEEGGWALSDAHKAFLMEIKRWMVGRRNILEIRGHASANLQDSVVREDDRFRPFTRSDLQRGDRNLLADHSMLSWLRAGEALRFLTAEHPELGDTLKLRETQVRVRADSYTRNVADAANPSERHKNRRIEVMATTDLLEE